MIVSTYQAVSGAGNVAMEDLKKAKKQSIKRKEVQREVLPVGPAKKHHKLRLMRFLKLMSLGRTASPWKK